MPQKTANTRRTDPPDERVMKAMAHPLRFKILAVLSERVASPNQLAQELEERIGTVAYHVNYLRDLDAVELVDTAQRRGATEHFYRATMRPWFSDGEYAAIPAPARRALFGPTVSRIVEDATSSLVGGGFDRADAHASWVTLDLDPEGYQEAVDLLNATLERLIELQAESATRAVEGEDRRSRTEAALLHFEPRER